MYFDSFCTQIYKLHTFTWCVHFQWTRLDASFCVFKMGPWRNECDRAIYCTGNRARWLRENWNWSRFCHQMYKLSPQNSLSSRVSETYVNIMLFNSVSVLLEPTPVPFQVTRKTICFLLLSRSLYLLTGTADIGSLLKRQTCTLLQKTNK